MERPSITILRIGRTTASFRLALAVLTAVLGWSAAIHGQSASIPLSVELPDNPMAGARLFVEKSCVRCHALSGDETHVGPDLGRIHLPGTVLDLAGAFWNHSPVMREKMQDLKIRPPLLTSQEMADLAAFLTAYRYYLTQVGQPADPSTGHRVFVSKGCARCHSGENDWNRPGPNLEPYRGRVSAILLAQAMWNHGSEMASAMQQQHVPWPRFTGREMGDLLAYLQAGNAGTGAERVYFEPGSPRRGRELFSAKRCDACHAIGGKGGRGGPDLGTLSRELGGSVASVAGLMWNHSLGMMAEFRRRGLPRVTFSGQEMADIIAYLYFVNYANARGNPTRGGELFVGKCSTCHSIGGGQRVGPDLGTIVKLNEPLSIITTMWNHASRMDQELRKRGMAWPRLDQGDAADLTAFLLTRRGTVIATRKE